VNAARISVTRLLSEGSLQQVPVDSDVVENLQRQARKHLLTAQAGLDVDDPEGAFQLAYDACRKLCLALLLAAGFRPKEDKGHHAVTFEGAAALAANFGRRKVVDEASDLRYVRNNTEYRAEMVDTDDAKDAIEIGSDLVAAFAGPISKLLERAEG
jgi:uncharacterized protein (UPF0332 family)